MTRLSALHTGSLIVLLASFSTASFGQDSTANSVIDRYSNLDLTREGPTIDADLPRKMYRRGNTYANLERHEEAIEEYRKAISADPNYKEAIRSLANTYFFLERYTETKPLLARYIELESDTTAGLIAAVQTLGQLERQDGNYLAAIDYDERAIALDHQNDSQVHVMANTYNNNGFADLAIRIYQAGIRSIPNNAFFDRSLGRILEQEGRMEDALAAYQSAADKDPDSDFYADLVENMQQRLAR